MKQFFLTLGILFTTILCFASNAPVISNSGGFKISIHNFDCTVTAYGYYTEPDGGLTDVRCTVTTTDCTAATAAAEACRNQNVCNRVTANGGTPPSNLGCKQDSIGDPVP